MTAGTDAMDRILREERAFVHELGGYSLELAGGVLVTHERIPVPRFNFVQEVRLAESRRTAFFEKALDHYFQRALRPAFRVREPVPAHVAKSLVGLGFHLRPEPFVFLNRHRTVSPPTSPLSIHAAEGTELDVVAEFLTNPPEREELQRALAVATSQPTPGESIRPFVAVSGSDTVSTAIAHRSDGVWGIHAVATRPKYRSQGAATALVGRILSEEIGPEPELVSMTAEVSRLLPRLRALGLDEIARFRVFELTPTAELALPKTGRAGPPLWRPPRRGRTDG